MTRSRSRFEWRWLILVVAFAAVLAVAIMLNTNTTDNSVSKLLGGIKTDNSDLNVNWERYQSIDVKLSETLKITESGTYHLTGSLENGQIIVDAGVSEVRIILDNVTISNPTGPAILAYNAENLVIELVGDNVLMDGVFYDSNYDPDVSGVIYSKADLAFTGKGTLDITANFADGIVGKDDVVIRDGNYIINANDDGIRGKDSVYITGGNFTINSGDDAIKSTNDTDYGKGFVMIENGEYLLRATGKGLNAQNTVLIYGGNLIFATNDDAVHSNSYVGLVDGTLTIDSGDDGIHANKEIVVDGGTVNITKSYEGIEAQVITVNNGMINIVASDDGINAGGGADSSANNRPGASPFDADESCIVTINGGTVYINAAGDGIDSNGYLIFNGGSTVVDGPTNNGNGALDAGAGISLEGGEAIAVGAAGMAESLGKDSDVCNISVFFTSVQKAGTVVEIRNADDEIIMSHTAAKSFSHLAAGSEKLTLGGTYTIYLNNNEYQSFTILEVTTTIGNSNINPNNMVPGDTMKRP